MSHEVVIAAALRVPNPVRALGGAVWLYLTLMQAANHRGIVVRTRARLAEALSISEELVDIFLKRLKETRLIVITSPSPYLVISFPAWPNSNPDENAKSPHRREVHGQIALEVPVSKQLAAADLKKANGVGGSGEGAGDLLAELQREFPDAERADLLRDVGKHTESIVRQALVRVRATPVDQIRKSRLALFRYLLGKLSRESR